MSKSPSLRKLKKNLFWQCVPIYGTQLFVSVDGVGPIEAYFGDDLGFYGDGVSGQVDTIEHENGASGVLVAFSDYDHNTVAHECVHAAWSILDIHGIEVEVDNHEALAYLVGYLMDVFCAAIEKRVE